MDLVSAVTDAWSDLKGANFVVNAVWFIRTKELLGALAQVSISRSIPLRD